MTIISMGDEEIRGTMTEIWHEKKKFLIHQIKVRRNGIEEIDNKIIEGSEMRDTSIELV